MNSSIETVYNKHKNLKVAADELGMKWQTLYVQLRKLGVPVTGDKSKYGSAKDKLAAQAELAFSRIVPFAQNQNLISFQSKFDFLVGKEKVDIKASIAHQGCKKFTAKRWAFSVKKQEFCADFIVCFAMTGDSYRIFLIPGEIVRNYQTISISSSKDSKSKWLQYEIEPQELCSFFEGLL